MTPAIPPNAALSVLGQATGGVQRYKQLEKFGDQVLIDALAVSSTAAASAAKAIVDEAEGILSDADACRWDNDEDVHALHVRITHYLYDHPRLTDLNEALRPVPDLLFELRKRAGRRLQMPNTKRDKQSALTEADEALDALGRFINGLPFNLKELLDPRPESLPEDPEIVAEMMSGVSPEMLSELDRITQTGPDDRAMWVEDRGHISYLVAEGRKAVSWVRADGVSSQFTAALTKVRIAFAWPSRSAPLQRRAPLGAPRVRVASYPRAHVSTAGISAPVR